MRTSTIPALALALLVPAAVASIGASDSLTVLPGSRIWVDGTSTVRSFSCRATTFDAEIQAAPGAAAAVLTGEKAVQSATVTVPAGRLDCGNGTMNDHMREALKAKTDSVITFHLTSYDVATKGSDSVSGTLDGALTVGGTTRTIAIAAVARRTPDGTLRVIGSYDLSMKNFGLRPPSLFFGSLRVGDRVRVNFDLLLKG